VSEPNLKSLLAAELATEQALDRLECSREPLFFLERHVTIEEPDGRVISFRLWPFQRATVEALTNSTLAVVLKARRMGLSWIALALALWSKFYEIPDNLAAAALERPPGQTVSALAPVDTEHEPFSRRRRSLALSEQRVEHTAALDAGRDPTLREVVALLFYIPVAHAELRARDGIELFEGALVRLLVE
jgi:hypothetical protein